MYSQMILPPEWEINFGIGLILDTRPFSIPPNRMTITELKKLNNFLKDFLDKGFI